MTTEFVIPPELIETIRNAQHIVVLTGAGTSAESGVPTFRDAQTGLWAQYNPQELATPEAFKRNPQLVWDWYEWRRKLVRKADPNPGHFALVTMQKHAPQFDLITQNVDGMHQRAGSTNVTELHGNLNRCKCSLTGEIFESWAETEDPPPSCPNCNGLLRPDVVWFGESLPATALSHAFQVASQCDLLFSIGTSGLVHPAASIPIAAVERKIPTVEINPDATTLSPAMDYVLNGPSGQLLPLLIKAAWGNA